MTLSDFHLIHAVMVFRNSDEFGTVSDMAFIDRDKVKRGGGMADSGYNTADGGSEKSRWSHAEVNVL